MPPCSGAPVPALAARAQTAVAAAGPGCPAAAVEGAAEAAPRPALAAAVGGAQDAAAAAGAGCQVAAAGVGPAGVAPGAHQTLGVPREVQCFAPVPAGGWAVPAHRILSAPAPGAAAAAAAAPWAAGGAWAVAGRWAGARAPAPRPRAAWTAGCRGPGSPAAGLQQRRPVGQRWLLPQPAAALRAALRRAARSQWGAAASKLPPAVQGLPALPGAAAAAEGAAAEEAAAPAMVGARPTRCACAAGPQGSPCCLRAPSAGQTPLQEQHLLPVGK